MSLAARIKVTFVMALTLVLVTGVSSLYYLFQLNNTVGTLLKKDIQINKSGQTIKILFLNVRQSQRDYIRNPTLEEEKQNLERHVKKFQTILQVSKKTLVGNIAQTKLNFLEEHIKNYLLVLPEDNEKTNTKEVRKRLKEEEENILGTIEELILALDKDRELLVKDIETLIRRAKRNLLLVLFVTFLGGIIITYFAPKSATLPIKRFLSAIENIKDLQDNIKVPEGNDEMGQIASSLNKLFEQIKEFDEIKTKKIIFEKRRFDALCNSLNFGVAIASVEGNLLYLNSQLFRLLHLETSVIEKKPIIDLPISKELKELFQTLIDNKEKVRGKPFLIRHEKPGVETLEVGVEITALPIRNYQGQIVNMLVTFQESTVKDASYYLNQGNHGDKDA